MTPVKVSVTFRHTRPTAALKRYTVEKAQKIGKYLYRPAEAHVVLAADSKDQYLAEVTLQSGRLNLHSKEGTADLYQAIDQALHKIERQVKKEKNRLEKRRAMR